MPNPTPTSATITTTTAASFIPELWADMTLDAVEYSAMFQKRVNRKLESIATVGKTFDVPRLSNLSTQAKSYGGGLGTTIAYESITEGKQQLTVNTVEYAAFLAEDPALVQVNQDIVAKYANKIGYALTRGREVKTFAQVQSLTNVQGTANVEFTFDDFLAAHQQMLLAGIVPDNMTADEDFSVFLSPQAWIAALKLDVLTNKLYNPEGNAIQRAEVGKILSYPVYVSLLTNPTGSTDGYAAGTGGHDCVMLHRDAIALVVQRQVPVKAMYLISNLGTGYVAWNLYGTSVLSFPPEAMGGGTAVANRGVWLRTV